MNRKLLVLFFILILTNIYSQQNIEPKLLFQIENGEMNNQISWIEPRSGTYHPQGFNINGNLIYICDRVNNRIAIWETNGQFVKILPNISKISYKHVTRLNIYQDNSILIYGLDTVDGKYLLKIDYDNNIKFHVLLKDISKKRISVFYLLDDGYILFHNKNSKVDHIVNNQGIVISNVKRDNYFNSKSGINNYNKITDLSNINQKLLNNINLNLEKLSFIGFFNSFFYWKGTIKGSNYINQKNSIIITTDSGRIINTFEETIKLDIVRYKTGYFEEYYEDFVSPKFYSVDGDGNIIVLTGNSKVGSFIYSYDKFW